jgi:hypothetical protein
MLLGTGDIKRFCKECDVELKPDVGPLAHTKNFVTKGQVAVSRAQVVAGS